MPVPDRAPDYADHVWNRLRWRLERRRARTWQWMTSVAAMLVIAFIGALWWNQRPHPSTATRQPSTVATTNPATQQPSNPATANNVLVFVVTDHLDAAERVLAEVANADPKKALDVEEEQKRAEDLVAANRIYRQTATQRGDARIASLLSDIEPILVELSHSGAQLTPEELASMQKRIDSKNLLFKVRVMSQNDGRNENVLASQHLNSL